MAAPGFETVAKVAGMQLQLVPIRIEKVEGIGPVHLLPAAHACAKQPLGHQRQFRCCNVECRMGILRQRAAPHFSITHQGQPQHAPFEVSRAWPAHPHREAKQLRVKRHRTIEVADRQRQMIKSGDHTF